MQICSFSPSTAFQCFVCQKSSHTQVSKSCAEIESELAISLCMRVDSAVPILVDKTVYIGYYMHNFEGSARY